MSPQCSQRESAMSSVTLPGCMIARSCYLPLWILFNNMEVIVNVHHTFEGQQSCPWLQWPTLSILWFKPRILEYNCMFPMPICNQKGLWKLWRKMIRKAQHKSSLTSVINRKILPMQSAGNYAVQKCVLLKTGSVMNHPGRASKVTTQMSHAHFFPVPLSKKVLFLM